MPFLIDHPLAEEIHPVKNSHLDINIITTGSSTNLWWQCAQGHEWENEVRYRTRAGNTNNCPICSNRKVIPGINDLWTTHPELAKHLTNPADGYAHVRGSKTLLQWTCANNHMWKARVANQNDMAPQCKECMTQEATQALAHTSFAVTHPSTAAELLNPEEATQYTYGSRAKLQWICPQKHTWKATIKSRTILRRGCPVCSGHTVLPGETDAATIHPALTARWHPQMNTDSLADYTTGSDHKAWWQCTENADHNPWFSKISDATRGRSNCPACSYERQTSAPENELFQYITDLLPEEKVYRSYRSLIAGELDIYVPNLNVAVEFNGLYWHSEAQGKDNRYHYNKWEACAAKNVQLIQIWEDEWNRNPELIRTMIAHKLGVSPAARIHARKTSIHEISKEQADAFLNQHHIQGAASGSIRYGLLAGDELVALMILKREPNQAGTYNLVRFATSVTVAGGFTKLLKHATHAHSMDAVITFSDNTVSDGKLYQRHGFTHTADLPPDYKYVVKNERAHKFGYRLKRFRNDPNLLFEEGKTEKQLAALNRIPRIWDAGKKQWTLTISNEGENNPTHN